MNSKAELVALRDERQTTLAALSEAFATDLIDVDEYERRVELANDAETAQALMDLRQDLAIEPAPKSQSVALAATRPEKRSIISVIGGAERKGQWVVPETLRVVTVLGGAELDFREAIFGPGRTDVRVTAVLGGVEIIVPPTIRVVCHGTAILGGFEFLEQSDSETADAPEVHIHGFALMGGVEIQSRYPGESGREARRRRKREHKALKEQRNEATKLLNEKNS